MRRREFIAGLSGAAAMPFAGRAQTRPVIGYLSTLSETAGAYLFASFRRGLGEVGFEIGRNVEIEFRWAEGRFDLLPNMAGDLVRRQVDLILAQAPPAALSAKAATPTIPIVFVVGFDPVASGLVASLNRPGGNATGITLMSAPISEKRLEILRELAPQTSAIAMLTNPLSPDAIPEIRSVQAAAQAMGLSLKMYNASTPSEVEAAFTTIGAQRPGPLLIGTDPFFVIRRADMVALANRLKIPVVYPFREYAAAGGLISYGSNIPNSYRQAGIYAGRILKGLKPSELPVMQPTAFEMVINQRTASALEIEIPPMLHAQSSEVIE